MSFSGSRLIDERTRESGRLRLSCSDSLPAHRWQRSLLRGTLTSQRLRKRAASTIAAPHDGKYAVVTMKEDTCLCPMTQVQPLWIANGGSSPSELHRSFEVVPERIAETVTATLYRQVWAPPSFLIIFATACIKLIIITII